MPPIQEWQPVDDGKLILGHSACGLAKEIGVLAVDQCAGGAVSGEVRLDVATEELGDSDQIAPSDHEHASGFGLFGDGLSWSVPCILVEAGGVLGYPIDGTFQGRDHLADDFESWTTETVVHPLLDSHVQDPAREQEVGEGLSVARQCEETADAVVPHTGRAHARTRKRVDCGSLRSCSNSTLSGLRLVKFSWFVLWTSS